MAFILDEKLRPYATEKQWKYLEALEEHGTQRKAAEAMGGISDSVIFRAKQAVYKKAAIHGYAPDHDLRHPVPLGFNVKGTSILRDAQTGEAKLIWEKSERTKEDMQEVMREAVEALCEDITPLKPADLIGYPDKDLLNLYTISDYHMGMLAWKKEGGDDWDLKIAEETLMRCFQMMVNRSPNAKTAVVNQLGDFLHSDGILPVTPTSHHILDQDGRFSNIARVAVKCLRAMIDMALKKHKHVHIILAEGNHDISSSIWLRIMFKTLYENEPRVSVDDSEIPYYAYQHGKVGLFFHHGHKTQFAQLPSLFAAQFAPIWGNTIHRYGHAGDKHHKAGINQKDSLGIEVTQHPTLASRDAYAARGGWFSMRGALAHTYHVDHGEVEMTRTTPYMIKNPIENKSRKWYIKT